MKTLAITITLSAVFGATPAGAASGAACVAAKLDPSLNVIDQLRDHQLDLARPRAVSHLFLGSVKKLRVAATEIAGFGYSVQDLSKGRLLVVATMPVSIEWVEKTILQMCTAAAAAGVEYDGWDIDVAADHVSSNAGQ